MFIDGTILDWSYYSDNSSGRSAEGASKIVWRAHEIWRHATSQVSTDSDEFKLSDAISNLKRAINHRLQALNQAYSFEALPFTNRKQTLEKLQFYGIIRPAIVRELFEVRNLIEHQDGRPPNIEHCKRYVDFTWYFLKSTDSLLLLKVDDVIFWSDGENDVSLDFRPEFDGSWNITVVGDLPDKYILERMQAGAVELDCTINRPAYIRVPIYGRWNPTSEQLTIFARKYFELSGYSWEYHV